MYLATKKKKISINIAKTLIRKKSFFYVKLPSTFFKFFGYFEQEKGKKKKKRPATISFEDNGKLTIIVACFLHINLKPSHMPLGFEVDSKIIDRVQIQ